MNPRTIAFWFFIFPAYTVPTLFLLMAKGFDAWPLLLWGGFATIFGVVFMESGR